MGEKITHVEGLKALPPPKPSTLAIAINGSRKSRHVVRWALDKFVPEGVFSFKFIHVRPKIIGVPTPMGNLVHITRARDDVVAAFRKDMEWQASEKLLPYKLMCTQRQVEVEIRQIESDDVADAISEEVAKSNTNRLVIGASSRTLFSRGQNLSTRISKCTPGFCTVYAVSKGKLLSVRPSDSGTNCSAMDERSDTSSTNNSSSRFSSQEDWTDQSSTTSWSHLHPPSPPLIQPGTPNMNQVRHIKTNSNDAISCITSSIRSGEMDADSSSRLSCSDVDVNFELEKLRIELRHLQGMYAMAQGEAHDASRKLSNLNKCHLEETIKLKELSLKEEEAKELAEQEKEKYEAAKREVDSVKECAEREAALKREAEAKAIHEAKEKEKLENALVGQVHRYKKFTWEEIISATSSLSEDLRVGMGAYGTVYKCSLNHTTAAVKILHSKDAYRTKQFHQELAVLSKIRHPHLLTLLGACPDHGCLVYEFMENGSLEERLMRINNSGPLPWFDRCRIAWEVGSALVFLHNSKPKPIIHRDLKPANILLDHNFVSKIGDVGLSTMLHSESSISISYKDTGLVGTFFYIDPEYQRTGLISQKSDVYAFGMVILRLLTAKPAIALAHMVEKAFDNDCLMDLIDQDAGEWPVQEVKEMARLALKCTELKSKDRPDLKDEVLPVLEKLKEIAAKARDLAPSRSHPPSHFVCPILKEVMENPCVAADGYTYDRKAIEAWLEENDKSPMTNLPLQHKNLLPNYTLLSAIVEWKTQKN